MLIIALFRRPLLKLTVTITFIFLRHQSFQPTSQKTVGHHCLSVVIGRFPSILFTSVFQGFLAVDIIVLQFTAEKNYLIVIVDLSRDFVSLKSSIKFLDVTLEKKTVFFYCTRYTLNHAGT